MRHSLNQIVILESEIKDQEVFISNNDNRYQHLIKVLKLKPKDQLKACILNQGHIDLKTISISNQSIHFKYDEIIKTPNLNLKLIIGLSRPPSIKKILEHATCMGVNSFIVTNTKLSEKSFLESKVFKESSVDQLLNLGLSQSVKYYQKPSFQLINKFNNLDKKLNQKNKINRFILCPSSKNWLKPKMIDFTQDITVAIGSERGFTKQEEQYFQKLNFVPIKISDSILRVEIATYSILAQLELLRNQS